MSEEFKRFTAYKLRIGDVLSGKPVFDGEKFKLVELGDKRVSRVNVIANVTEKFIQDDEKKFGSLTIDDGSGQIKLKAFGEEIHKLDKFNQGDTVMVVGLLRSWNNEVYVMPEIIKKKEPEFLLVRKLEVESEKPKELEKSDLMEMRDQIITVIKREDGNGGADIEKMIMELKSPPTAINQEIKRLLEEGVIYEPRPGKVRYLG
jgi:uncharacterized protein